MATLDGRSGRALLVVDLQEGVIDGAHRRDEVVATTVDLVDRARAAAAQVIWVQHHDGELTRGTPAWQWVPELEPGADEPLVEKSYGDAFAETSLEQPSRTSASRRSCWSELPASSASAARCTAP